jgi:RNA-directed DNA polymerase
MTFSMEEKALRGYIRDEVERIVNSLAFPKLMLNERKTIFGSKAHRRTVTGLILSNDGTVSLGREKKRRIRAKIHSFIMGRLSEDERATLKGYLAYARSIEPGFVQRMERRYGSDVLKSI